VVLLPLETVGTPVLHLLFDLIEFRPEVVESPRGLLDGSDLLTENLPSVLEVPIATVLKSRVFTRKMKD